jgi:hypothetical protein
MAKTMDPLRSFGLGQYCIVRTESAGVFAGELIARDGKEAVVAGARRIWSWEGAATLSELAMSGTKKPGQCKFPQEVDHVLVTGVIEVIPCSAAGKDSIRLVPVWKA